MLPEKFDAPVVEQVRIGPKVHPTALPAPEKTIAHAVLRAPSVEATKRRPRLLLSQSGVTVVIVLSLFIVSPRARLLPNDSNNALDP